MPPFAGATGMKLGERAFRSFASAACTKAAAATEQPSMLKRVAQVRHSPLAACVQIEHIHGLALSAEHAFILGSMCFLGVRSMAVQVAVAFIKSMPWTQGSCMVVVRAGCRRGGWCSGSCHGHCLR